MSDQEFVDGYLDGRDPDAPEPSVNRSHRYRHSFAVGRAEIENRWLGTFEQMLNAADVAALKDQSA